MFDFFKRRRRARMVARPFPAEWRDVLVRNVGWYEFLSPQERTKLEGDLRIFLGEKYWEGCAGLSLTDEIKVTIAGQASLLTLAWNDYHFERVQTILVYPASYRSRGRQEFGSNLPTERVGEALDGGPVVLSWRDSLVDARGTSDGHNVVLHEFAHILDMDNGEADGIPFLASDAIALRWQEVIQREMEQMYRQMTLRRPTFLVDYAATSPAEFFAVATEAFFEQAPAFQFHLPEMYELMRDFYQQDPAQRWTIIGPEKTE